MLRPERGAQSRFTFGPFQLDASTRQLTRSGQPVALAPKTFDLLLLLLESNGRMLTKAELMQALWQDTFVEEANLTFQISTLRKALGQEGAWIETAPKVGYRFNVPAEKEAVIEPAPAPPPRRRQMILVSAGLPVLLVAAFWVGSRSGTPIPSLEPIPLTTYEGTEGFPSFSPDGSQVAFTWNGGKQGTPDIYVKTIGSEASVRLTTSGNSCAPSWSPDGRFIAYTRLREGIYLIAPTGGAERKLVSDPPPFCSQVTWSSDSRHVAFPLPATGNDPAGIFLALAQGGVPRRLTKAEPNETHRWPTFSNDGRWLAFVSCTGAADTCTTITLLPLDAQLNPRGAQRLITTTIRIFGAISWTVDGTALIFSSDTGSPRLYRTLLSAGAEPQLLSFAGRGARSPAVSRTGNRMAFSRDLEDIDFWKMENGQLVRSPLSSTVRESNPQFSPDGKRVVFTSHRSGRQENWVANADGSGAMQLTNSIRSGTPRWSPDGRWVVYDNQGADGRYSLNVVDAAGGASRTIVRNAADAAMASFSRNGKWIYFFSSLGGRNEIYRVAAEGDEPVRITDEGGVIGFESIDGKLLYYTKDSDLCGIPLFARPVAGGPEKQVLDSVCGRTFQVTEQGIYYASKSMPEETVTVRLFDPAAGTSREVRQAKGKLYGLFALAVSPDGNTILVTGSSQRGTDLYLVENFH